MGLTNSLGGTILRRIWAYQKFRKRFSEQGISWTFVRWCFHINFQVSNCSMCGFDQTPTYELYVLGDEWYINFQRRLIWKPGNSIGFHPLPSMHAENHRGFLQVWKTNGVQAKTMSEVRWTSLNIQRLVLKMQKKHKDKGDESLILQNGDRIMIHMRTYVGFHISRNWIVYIYRTRYGKHQYVWVKTGVLLHLIAFVCMFSCSRNLCFSHGKNMHSPGYETGECLNHWSLVVW